MIDTALRHVALEKSVEVYILVSCWPHSRPDIVNYLLSLSQLNGVQQANIQLVSGQNVSTCHDYVIFIPDYKLDNT